MKTISFQLPRHRVEICCTTKHRQGLVSRGLARARSATWHDMLTDLYALQQNEVGPSVTSASGPSARLDAANT